MDKSKKNLDSYGTFLKEMQKDTKTLAQQIVAELLKEENLRKIVDAIMATPIAREKYKIG
jgi:hypothetical protein